MPAALQPCGGIEVDSSSDALTVQANNQVCCSPVCGLLCSVSVLNVASYLCMANCVQFYVQVVNALEHLPHCIK